MWLKSHRPRHREKSLTQNPPPNVFLTIISINFFWGKVGSVVHRHERLGFELLKPPFNLPPSIFWCISPFHSVVSIYMHFCLFFGSIRWETRTFFHGLTMVFNGFCVLLCLHSLLLLVAEIRGFCLSIPWSFARGFVGILHLNTEGKLSISSSFKSISLINKALFKLFS